eukprot:3157269-Rhodomonas_salina.2
MAKEEVQELFHVSEREVAASYAMSGTGIEYGVPVRFVTLPRESGCVVAPMSGPDIERVEAMSALT